MAAFVLPKGPLTRAQIDRFQEVHHLHHEGFVIVKIEEKFSAGVDFKWRRSEKGSKARARR